DLVVDRAGDADSPLSCQTFEMCGEMSPFFRDLLRIHQHLAKSQPEAELYPPLGRKRGITLLEILLDGYRAAQSFDNAVKFSQQIISGHFRDSAPILANEGSHKFLVSCEGMKDGCSIRFYQADRAPSL